MEARIDLHLHSFNSKKNGDSIKWDSLFDSIKRLKNNKVQICAFSDHNVFKPSFYLEASRLAKTANILVLPAIEVNVVRKDGKIANIIYIFEENLEIEELKKIEKITKLNISKRGIDLKLVDEIFKDFKIIKIPHVGKSDHFKYEDLCEITFDAIEVSSLTNPNYVFVSKQNIKTSVVSFSDTHIWNLYPQQHKLITIIDDLNDLSFESLKESLNKNKNYTKEM